MKCGWQVILIFSIALSALRAEPGAKAFVWEPLKVEVSAFSSDLGMLGAERDEYATNLANCAVARVAETKASAASLEMSRHLLSLALNLSPRNRRSVVANFQLAKGLIPEVGKGDYSPQVLARLLLTRGQLLVKQPSLENAQLARMFFQLAAELDPKNDDAVYASEVDRLDHGSVDWTFLTRPRVDPEKEAGPSGPAPPQPAPPQRP